MSAKKIAIAVAVVCVLVMAIFLLRPGITSHAQAPAGTSTVPYAGQLSKTGQTTVDGAYDFTFSLYDALEAGDLLWSEQQTGVTVSGGKFSTDLGVAITLPNSLFERKEAWLEVSLRGPGDKDFTTLSPRQLLATDAPQSIDALACPHSHFTDYWGGANSAYGIEVDNSSGLGDGLRGYSGATAYNYAGVYAVNGGGTSAGNGGSGAYAYSANGYGGYFASGNYRALYAKGNAAWYAAYIENPMGASNVGLYVNGTMWVTGAKAGFVVDIAVNDGTEPLETGDLVVISGYGDPVVGLNPLIKVRKSDQAGATTVMGVVDQPYNSPTTQSNPTREPLGPTSATANKADGTAITPGGYLSVVTLGAYKAVKVDASYGPIAVGDLLVASSNPGYAMASADPKLGSVIGKALSEWLSGTGVIPVLVTLK
jgi:hypothetical protein